VVKEWDKRKKDKEQGLSIWSATNIGRIVTRRTMNLPGLRLELALIIELI